MKTVFILGAGASAQAGGPLMAEFLDKAQQLDRRGSVTEQHESFTDVFNAISELQNVYIKSHLDLDNIETIFGAIEMGLVINKLADRNHDEIKSLRRSLITMIVTTLEHSIIFPAGSGLSGVGAAVPYGTLIDIILKVKEQRGEQDVSFITFNYDIAIDQALHVKNVPFDYCLTEQQTRTYPLLKLHGSINWGMCQVCDAVVPRQLRDVPPTIIPIGPSRPELTFRYEIGEQLSKTQHCGKPIKGPPVLVPPTWNKAGYHEELSSVWRRAAKELGLAENIFVIGYSLPETDSFFRYLFALATQGSGTIRNFWVCDPKVGNVKARFRTLIGPAIEKRFELKTVNFSGVLGEIQTTLLQQ